MLAPLMKACTAREKAKGATFFEATEGETVRPMLDVSWAPMLGAFSVLFEEYGEGTAQIHNDSQCELGCHQITH